MNSITDGKEGDRRDRENERERDRREGMRDIGLRQTSFPITVLLSSILRCFCSPKMGKNI